MYRGQDIGDLKQLEEKCVAILKQGKVEALYDILPHLAIVRAPSFRPPVEKLLASNNRDKKQFAVIALGILGGQSSLRALTRLSQKIQTWQGPGVRSLERTLISSLGESGSADAIAPLLELFRFKHRSDKFADERRRAVVTALATLVQQGIEEAREELLDLLSHPSRDIRAQTAVELGFAFWNQPQNVPDKVLESLRASLKDPEEAVQVAALSTLRELAELGNNPAQTFLPD